MMEAIPRQGRRRGQEKNGAYFGRHRLARMTGGGRGDIALGRVGLRRGPPVGSVGDGRSRLVPLSDCGPDHRQKARLDGARQAGPRLDHGRKVRVDRGELVVWLVVQLVGTGFPTSGIAVPLWHGSGPFRLLGAIRIPFLGSILRRPLSLLLISCSNYAREDSNL